MAEQRRQAGEIPAQVKPGEVALYRFFDQEGALLYIGIAEQPLQRWYAHSHRDWWSTVARYEVAWFESRSEADGAERVAVKAERPRYNVVYNRERRPRSDDLGSPTLARIVLRDFRGKQVTVSELAKATRFSTTSANKTLRALVASGRAEIIGAPGWTKPRVYAVFDAEAPAE